MSNALLDLLIRLKMPRSAFRDLFFLGSAQQNLLLHVRPPLPQHRVALQGAHAALAARAPREVQRRGPQTSDIIHQTNNT